MIKAWVIYDHPKDYPDHWVVRVQKIVDGQVVPEQECTLHATLADARKAIPGELCLFPPFVDDDPVIAEVWM